jgi:hypothetical protein
VLLGMLFLAFGGDNCLPGQRQRLAWRRPSGHLPRNHRRRGPFSASRRNSLIPIELSHLDCRAAHVDDLNDIGKLRVDVRETSPKLSGETTNGWIGD